MIRRPFIASIPARLAIALVRVYQWVISPIVHTLCGPGCGCRFYPSCSEYTRVALQRHGFFHGGLLGLRRISRCHPWHPGGCDPVPARPDRSGADLFGYDSGAISRSLNEAKRPLVTATPVRRNVRGLKTNSLTGIPQRFRKH